MAKKKQKTLVVIVLDRSYSMDEIIDETVAGFNSEVQKLHDMEAKYPDQEITVSLVSFADDVYEHIWNRPVADMPKVTRADCKGIGWTALRDGMGYAISKMKKTLAECDPETTAVWVKIISDGDENKSRHVSPSQLKELIASCPQADPDDETKKGNWTISYLGCSKENVLSVANDFGLHASNCASFTANTKVGARKGYGSVTRRMDDFFAARGGGVMASCCLMSDSIGEVADFEDHDEDDDVNYDPPVSDADEQSDDNPIAKALKNWTSGTPRRPVPPTFAGPASINMAPPMTLTNDPVPGHGVGISQSTPGSTLLGAKPVAQIMLDGGDSVPDDDPLTADDGDIGDRVYAGCFNPCGEEVIESNLGGNVVDWSTVKVEQSA